MLVASFMDVNWPNYYMLVFFYDFRGASILIASPIWTVLISSPVKIGDVRLANYENPVPLCCVCMNEVVKKNV